MTAMFVERSRIVTPDSPDWSGPRRRPAGSSWVKDGDAWRLVPKIQGGTSNSFMTLLPNSVISADGSSFTNTLTETALVNLYNFQANYWYVGKTIRVVARGRVSTAASSPGNLTLALRWGTATGGVMLANTGAQALLTSQTAIPFDLECDITCRAVGTGTNGSLFAEGRAFIGAISTSVSWPMPANTPAAAAVDSVSANTLAFTGLYSAASASNIVIVHIFYIIDAD